MRCVVLFFYLLPALLGGRVQAWNPAGGDLSKANANDIRIMAWNLARNFPQDAALLDNFTRVMQAVDPDVLICSEINDADSAAVIKGAIDSILPLPAGETWRVQLGQSDGFIRVALISRFPLLVGRTDTIPASEVRGVNCALIDLPDAVYQDDFYLMGIHLKAQAGGTNTARRQQACNALANWFADLRSPGGNVTLASSMPILVAGDTNFVDGNPQQPEITLRTGDITDNATYGTDRKGDWDNTDLTDLTPANPFNGSTVTYPSFGSRIDRCYYTDSTTQIPTKFVLNTQSMNSTQRSAAGVQQRDTTDASDHLPIIFDLRLPIVPVELSMFGCE